MTERGEWGAGAGLAAKVTTANRYAVVLRDCIEAVRERETEDFPAKSLGARLQVLRIVERLIAYTHDFDGINLIEIGDI